MNLRPRERSKEIQTDLRYKAKSNVEKVIDLMKNRNALSQVEQKNYLSKHLYKKGLRSMKNNIDLVTSKDTRRAKLVSNEILDQNIMQHRYK